MSDTTYVAYFRLDGIKDMVANELAAAASILAQKVKSCCQSKDEVRDFSSVYGRFILVPRSVTVVLDLAKKIRQECHNDGVCLGIGVACGSVRITRDLMDLNVAGIVVNLAARLAHLPDGAGRIAIEKTVFRDVTSANRTYLEGRDRNEQPQNRRVKRTALELHWLDDQPLGPFGSLTPMSGDVAETVHAVVYDLAGFSDHPESWDLAHAVNELNQAMDDVFKELRVSPRSPSRDSGMWYSPAGDGGALVFRDSLAWRFADALRRHTFGRMRLRIGVATGQVVILGDSLPVGQAILEADALSALAEEGSICASARFWEQALQGADKVGWCPRRLPAGEDGDPAPYLLGCTPTTPLPAAQPSALVSQTSDVESDRAFLRRYRDRLVAFHSKWDLRSVGVTQPGGPARPLTADLDEMYQPLRFAEKYDPNKTDRGRPIDADALLARCLTDASAEGPAEESREARGLRGHLRPLAIWGSAGTGKTTWMRYTFRRLLQREDTLPIMIALRDVAKRWTDLGGQTPARSLDAFLDDWIAGYGFYDRPQQLRHFLARRQGPRPVLLVDGWDELGWLGDEFRVKLLGFMEEYPHVLVVVSSRPYGDGRPARSEGFEELAIQPLSKEEIDAFALRFFKLCYCPEDTMPGDEARHFRAALNETPEAARMAQTALLLTMILLITRSEPLPDKRHHLYDRCITNLLAGLPQKRTEGGAVPVAETWRPENSEVRMQCVAALASAVQSPGFAHANRSTIVLPWEDMMECLPPEVPVEKRDGFLRWLAESGLLNDRADGRVEFAHLSFQEYLTARHLHATVFDSVPVGERFLKLAAVPNWWETLSLWAALIGKEHHARLTPILTGLMDNGRLALAGKMIADGLGTDEVAQQWGNRFGQELLRRWPEDANLCLRAWQASQQASRKAQLHTSLVALTPRAKWIGWLRLAEAIRITHLGEEPPPPPVTTMAGNVLSALRESDPEPTADVIAAGRVFFGLGLPVWPVVPLAVGLLHLWPSRRRRAAQQLQIAASLGATEPELHQFARAILASPEPQADSAAFWPRSVAADLAHAWFPNLPEDETERKVAALAVSLGAARVPHWAGDLIRPEARALARAWQPGTARPWDPTLTQNLAQDVARGASRVQDARTFHKVIHTWVTRAATNWGLPEATPWLFDFGMLELHSLARGTTAMAVACAIEDGSRIEHGAMGAELELMARACRLALGIDADRRPLDAAAHRLGGQVAPTWPALARQLARYSTAADKRLLEAFAAQPQGRTPLELGGRFIVRGDLLLAEGRLLTLDALCDRLSIPRLPYLDA